MTIEEIEKIDTGVVTGIQEESKEANRRYFGGLVGTGLTMTLMMETVQCFRLTAAMMI